MHNKHWQNAYSFLIHVWQATNRHLMPSLLQRIKGALENVSNMMHAWRWHMHTAYWIICGNQRIGALCRRCYTEQTAPLNIFLTWCTLNTKSFIVLFDYVAPMINWHLVPLMIQRTKGTFDNTLNIMHVDHWQNAYFVLIYIWQSTNGHLVLSLLQRIKGAFETISNMTHAWRWHMHTAFRFDEAITESAPCAVVVTQDTRRLWIHF